MHHANFLIIKWNNSTILKTTKRNTVRLSISKEYVLSVISVPWLTQTEKSKLNYFIIKNKMLIISCFSLKVNFVLLAKWNMISSFVLTHIIDKISKDHIFLS